MIPAEAFLTTTLRHLPEGESVSRILAAAIAAVEPGEALGRFVRRDGHRLIISEQEYDLSSFNKVYLLGLGKASLAMAAAVVPLLGSHLTAGLLIAKHAGTGTLDERVQVVEGGHPVPDERSLQAGQQVLALLASLTAEDLLLCLISGGGSALVTAPVNRVSLADMQSLTSTLLASGASIQEINCLRRHLDRLKGGGLVQLSHGAAVVSLILSDVVGNALEVVASGPTAPDPAAPAAAAAILGKYHLEKKLPASLLAALQESPQPPAPGDPLFDRVHNLLVGSNLMAAQAALKQARQEGFQPYLLRTDQQGEARQAAFELATFLRQTRRTSQPLPPPACLISGGETTVTLLGHGKGGRNTELALAAVTELADFPGVLLVTLATDGEDGPTDAAGAVVTGDTWRRGCDLGMNSTRYLARNDSYAFFDALGDLIKIGPTGTNVNDLTLLFSL